MLILDRLALRTRTDGSSPFLTQYAGEQRTELSARSFSNWVIKTANLLADEFDLTPGDRVRLTVAEDHPAHWMTLVWTMATWQAGLVVVDTAAELEVSGPAPASQPTGPAVACSLHPLGRGLTGLPAGWTDFSSAALAQPDDWLGMGPQSENDPAWAVGHLRLTYADLNAVAPRSGRRVVWAAADPWEAVSSCLLAPLLGGGSTIVVNGDPSPPELAKIADAEKAAW